MSVSTWRKKKHEVGRSRNISEFREALDEQQGEIRSMLEEYREEVEEKLNRGRKRHNFQKKNIEKQFEVNEDLLALNRRIEREIRAKNYKKALSCLEEQKEVLKDHEEDLVVADSSKYGWLTVQKLKNTSCLNSSRFKKIEKIESLIERSQTNSNGSQGTSNQRKPFRMDKEVFQQSPAASFIKGRRPNRFGTKQSPEQVLEEALKATRIGPCSHRGKEGHFFRECSGFWENVQQSRVEFFQKN